MTQFEYTKEMIFAEFKEATAKDEKSKKPSYKHRIAMLKDFVDLKKSNPQSLDNVDINFENLLHAWSQPNPKDYFYMKVFGKTFEQKQKVVSPGEADAAPILFTANIALQKQLWRIHLRPETSPDY